MCATTKMSILSFQQQKCRDFPVKKQNRWSAPDITLSLPQPIHQIYLPNNKNVDTILWRNKIVDWPRDTTLLLLPTSGVYLIIYLCVLPSILSLVIFSQISNLIVLSWSLFPRKESALSSRTISTLVVVMMIPSFRVLLGYFQASLIWTQLVTNLVVVIIPNHRLVPRLSISTVVVTIWVCRHHHCIIWVGSSGSSSSLVVAIIPNHRLVSRLSISIVVATRFGFVVIIIVALFGWEAAEAAAASWWQ